MPTTIVRHSGTLFALAVIIAACTPDANDSIPTVAHWSIDSAAITIGRDESPEALLERVTGATRLADGRFIVADLGDAPLRRFTADGTLDVRLARIGSGPGEMNYLAQLFRCGDRLFTQDIDGRRISEFSLDGRYLREFRFALPEGQQAPYSSACNPDGRFVHLGWGTLRAQAGVRRDTVPMWITATAEGEVTVVDSVPSSERWGQTYDGRVVGSMPLPFGRQPVVGMGRDRIYVGSGDTFMVRVYTLDGVRSDSLRLDATPLPVTPADIRDRIERYVMERGETVRPQTERESAEIVYPATHPAYTALVVDREDHVWVRAYAPPSSATVAWHIFAPDGRYTATAELPRGLTVFEIGRDYVLGKFLDEDAAQPMVRMYGLRRTAEN